MVSLIALLNNFLLNLKIEKICFPKLPQMDFSRSNITPLPYTHYCFISIKSSANNVVASVSLSSSSSSSKSLIGT